MPPGSTDDLQYRLFKLLEENPHLSQREIAQELGLSVGKANYCLQELVQKGFVKVENFRKQDNKIAYAYILTPEGVAEKANVTRRFLAKKLKEFKAMRVSIRQLAKEVDQYRTR